MADDYITKAANLELADALRRDDTLDSISAALQHTLDETDGQLQAQLEILKLTPETKDIALPVLKAICMTESGLLIGQLQLLVKAGFKSDRAEGLDNQVKETLTIMGNAKLVEQKSHRYCLIDPEHRVSIRQEMRGQILEGLNVVGNARRLQSVIKDLIQGAI